MLKLIVVAGIGSMMCASVAHGGLIFNLTSQGQGVADDTNVGLSWIVLDTGGGQTSLTLTARSNIDSTQPFFLFAPGQLGTVMLGRKGGGVQDEFGGGSKEISGKGGDEDEELILNFGRSIYGNELKLDFVKIKLGNGLGNIDDPVLWVLYNDGEIAMFNEEDWGSAFKSTGGDKGTLDFEGLGFTSSDLIQQVVIRETNDHIVLEGGEFLIAPAPGALVLFAAAGLLGFKRRRRP